MSIKIIDSNWIRKSPKIYGGTGLLVICLRPLSMNTLVKGDPCMDIFLRAQYLLTISGSINGRNFVEIMLWNNMFCNTFRNPNSNNCWSFVVYRNRWMAWNANRFVEVLSRKMDRLTVEKCPIAVERTNLYLR